MIWKIIFLLMFIKVTVKAGLCGGKIVTHFEPAEGSISEVTRSNENQQSLNPNNSQQIPRNYENPQSSSSSESEQSSSSNGSEQEYLEELYNVEIVSSLNSMPTLDEKDVTFDEDDIQLLSVVCYPDVSCLNMKKASVKKYRRKMQAIQCIHALFVMKVMDKLEFIEYFLQDTVSTHRVYLRKMLSLLNMAKIAAYPWQIEIFTFVEGLADSDAEFEDYKAHFLNNKQPMRENTLAVINQCVHHKYLINRDIIMMSTIFDPITGLVDGVYSQMESLYKSGDLDAFRRLQDYTVSNLMFKHLYRQHDFVFEWLENGLELDTSSIKSKFLRYAENYTLLQENHKWELDPIRYNKYNSLISKCIHLRLVYAVWVHLYVYQSLQSRPSNENARLYRIWNTLVGVVTHNLRLFGFNENIYWSAIYIMRVELKNISDEELATREKFTRIFFCRAAKDLGLGSVSAINRQLEKIEVSENHNTAFNDILHNSKSLDSFENHITRTFCPVNGSFLRIIVSAKNNVTFFKHQTF